MLAQIYDYYRPHMRLFWLDFGCAVASGLLELAFPLAISGFIDHLLPSGDWGLAVAAAVGLILVYLLNTGLMAVVIYWGHKLGINIETEMRARAFAHLTKLGWGWFDRAETGKLVARVTRDLEEIGEVAHHGPEDLFIAIMTFVGAFALMAWLHLPLALMTLVIVPAMVWLLAVYGARMTRSWQNIYSRVGAFNVRLEESIGGIRVVQAFANEHHEQRLFAGDNSRYRDTKLEAYKIMAGATALHYMGLRFVQVIVMVAGAGFVFQGTLTTGSYVGFLLLVNVFFRPLEKIAAVIETYPRGIAGFQRYLDLLSTEPEITDAPGAKDAPDLKGRIEFDDVHFAYEGAKAVLHDISVTVEPGQTVALVGPSGAGKSTLMALVPRFYEPTQGEIRIDGIPLRDMTLDSLRRQVGHVSQDVFLFGGTLRENVAYGRLDATEEEILDAIEHAQLRPVLEAMPNGLDTVVGERGVMLSGGQRQRVAIARVFLRNPPILLLDEATSALDRGTEREVQAALSRLAVGRTTLIIAHRLNTIQHADRILVMEKGRIVESGNHEDLMTRQAAYYALVG
ncbi:ABC transporter ATP-binding protein [Allosediminivita pacifica]|uniref:ATP-binding cassette subfamily B protein n=1 Tax=Allosediminivita pacifica TaxID=1267769 RepID=A0A2T6AJH2_9RHOB|nr:ABC transporter ATP-binding protein [Allosediminivita pacifica]PTX43979.1 ATP-binding cassette subfamily B protein [Allosediminivita pacifica]GGB21197.1 multidrug ABC transporter ATP-binding protein [Allosediminivita pacifica]